MPSFHLVVNTGSFTPYKANGGKLAKVNR